MRLSRVFICLSTLPLFSILMLGQSGQSWAIRAIAAVGPNAVNTITASGNVTVTLDSNNQESGTIALQSSGIMQSQVTITTGAGVSSETHVWQNGYPSGSWTAAGGGNGAIADHNCWTEAVWFFPGLSMLADYNDQTLSFNGNGQVQFMGATVEDIQVYRISSPVLAASDFPLFSTLSTVDYYLNPTTALPVGMAFNLHADNNLNIDIPVVVTFAGYQSISGVQVPMQIVEYFNGPAYLQISLTSATPN